MPNDSMTYQVKINTFQPPHTTTDLSFFKKVDFPKRNNKTNESHDHFFSLPFNLFASAAAFTRVVGLNELLGFKAFRILNTTHAVPIACPAAPSPSCVASPACSPYLQ